METKENYIVSTLYTKRITDNKKNITFDKYLLNYKGKTFEVIITKDFAPELAVMMKDQKLSFPIDITLGDKDYFLKKKHYERNDGTKGMKYQVVISNVLEMKQGEFTSLTLDDVIEDTESETYKPE